MVNSIPYFGLILISLFLSATAWFKAKNKKLILLYLTNAGLIYLFEFLVLVLFKGYVYKPRIFHNTYFDNIFGANVSDGFIIPSISVLIAVFDLGFWWIAFFTLCFLGIEELFLYLGVYHHFWWKTVFTGISLPVEFFLGKWVWGVIRYNMNQFTRRLFILYFSDATIQATLFFYLAAVFHLFFFHIRWFPDPTRGHIVFCTIFILIESLFFSIGVSFKKKWLWNSILLGAITVMYGILYQKGIMEVPGVWAIGILTAFHAATLFLLLFFQKLLLLDRSDW